MFQNCTNDSINDTINDSINELIDNLDNSIYYVEGELQTVDNIYIKKSDVLTELKMPLTQLTDYSNLLEKSPLGLNNETVYDSKLRNAYHINAQDIVTNFHPSKTDIINIINRILMPDRLIHIEFHKLNIYNEEGFFIEHKDTPRANNMFGSLVVCLPNIFTDGLFTVRCNNHVKQCDNWIEKINSGLIPWIAFYSDCLHKIDPVTSGVRLTLTYNLYHKSYEIRNDFNISWTNLLENIFMNINKNNYDKKYIGYYTCYSYPQLINCNDDKIFDTICLKGNDYIFYNICKKLGLCVNIYPTMKYCKKILIKSDWEFSHCEYYDCDITNKQEFYYDNLNYDSLQSDKIIILNKPNNNMIGDIYTAYGNEASVDVDYINIIMIVNDKNISIDDILESNNENSDSDDESNEPITVDKILSDEDMIKKFSLEEFRIFLKNNDYGEK